MLLFALNSEHLGGKNYSCLILFLVFGYTEKYIKILLIIRINQEQLVQCVEGKSQPSKLGA